MDETSRIPRSFYFSAAVVGGLGLWALYHSFLTAPLQPTAHILLLVIAALVSENYALSLPAFNVSMAFPLIIAGIVLGGPTGGGLVAAVCFTNWSEVRGGRPWPPLVFNLGQLALAAVAGGWAYLGLGAQGLLSSQTAVPLSASDLPRVIAASLVAAIVFFLVNITLTSFAVSTLRGVAPAVVARSMFAYLPTQMALAFVGILIAQVLAVQIIAMPLFLFPLVLARQVYQRYENMRDVYLDTVRSLVGALEAKDPYTRGHSERVADYSVAIGKAMEVDAKTMEKLERAALLHDIGKLALPRGILGKSGALAPEETEAMQMHPALGEEMVRRIPPLRPIAGYVGMHHERVDGRGYPLGLSAQEIPLIPRILAVADAFDAMTTERAYRKAMHRGAATSELLRLSGAQFDARVVSGLLGVVGDERVVDMDTGTTNAIVTGAAGGERA